MRALLPLLFLLAGCTEELTYKCEGVVGKVVVYNACIPDQYNCPKGSHLATSFEKSETDSEHLDETRWKVYCECNAPLKPWIEPAPSKYELKFDPRVLNIPGAVRP